MFGKTHMLAFESQHWSQSIFQLSLANLWKDLKSMLPSYTFEHNAQSSYRTW